MSGTTNINITIIHTTGAYSITAGFCAIIVTTFHPTSGGPVCMQSSLDL